LAQKKSEQRKGGEQPKKQEKQEKAPPQPASSNAQPKLSKEERKAQYEVTYMHCVTYN
jgi:hypothetical protein